MLEKWIQFYKDCKPGLDLDVVEELAQLKVREEQGELTTEEFLQMGRYALRGWRTVEYTPLIQEHPLHKEVVWEKVK